MEDLINFYHLALISCSKCYGRGFVIGRDLATEFLCPCVARKIFHTVLARRDYFYESGKITQINYTQMEYKAYGDSSNAGVYTVYGIMNLEYCIDFEILARHSLSETQFLIFKLRYLQKKNFKVCCKRARLSRGNFFHMCYIIEQKVGLAALALKPYPLFPISDYFDQRLNRRTRIHHSIEIK